MAKTVDSRLHSEQDCRAAMQALIATGEDLGQIHDHDVRIGLIEEELHGLGDGSSTDHDHDLRPGLQTLQDRETAARAKRHAGLVKRWQRLEREGLHANLVRLSAMPLPAGRQR